MFLLFARVAETLKNRLKDHLKDLWSYSYRTARYRLTASFLDFRDLGDIKALINWINVIQYAD